MDRSNNKFKIIYVNAYQQIPVPFGSMLHIPLTNLLLLATKQEPYKKSLSLNKKYWKNFLEKVRENGPAGRKKIRQKE